MAGLARWLCVGSVLVATTAAVQAQTPIVGAIRWDAWQDPDGVGVWTDKAMSPLKYHDRVPFFGQVLSDTQVKINGNSQAVMDQEIAYAARAGLKYWAFVTYPDSFTMSNGLHLYLSSTKKAQINFALDLQGGWISSEHETWAQQVSRYVGYFKEPTYQKVLNGRPLVYLFTSPVGTARFPTANDAKNAFGQLRQASIAAGTGDPYIVYQGWHGPSDAALMESMGLDAIGAYAVVAPGQDMPYSSLMTQATNFWNTDKSTGAKVVPITSAGWDNRPRADNPPPWDVGGTENYFRRPTKRELANHISQAIAWVKSNQTAANANAVLTYAWNEHDEGGWLSPTLSADGSIDTSRIDAVGKAIAQANNPITIMNGSFEGTVGSPWYRVPKEAMPQSFGWSTNAAEGAYIVATSGEQHFAAADDGGQALLMSSAGQVWQEVGEAKPETAYYLSLALLSDQYQGETPGTVKVEMLAGTESLGTWLLTSPAGGAWEEHIMVGLTDNEVTGQLMIRLTNEQGMAWVDNVTLGAITVPEPSAASFGMAAIGALAMRRTR